MTTKLTIAIGVFCAFALLSACKKESPPNTSLRSFESSFESESDFNGFFIVPAADFDSYQEKSSDNVHDGAFSHKASIVKARAQNNDSAVYLPHRAYPTIQFQKTQLGSFRTPCLVSLWVYLNMQLLDRPKGSIDDWMSFITLTPDETDRWARTVLLNITPDGYLKLVHVPNQGEQIRDYQADASNDPSGSLLFPYKKWVRIDMYIDFDATNGYAIAWQNGKRISQAKVSGGAGFLAQAHFGLYASAAIAAGVVYNDKLRIKEVANETEALALVAGEW